MRHVLRRRTLSAQILAIQSGVLIITLLAGFAFVVWYQHKQLDEQFEQRSLAVAETVAASRPLQQAIVAGDPDGVVQRMASAVWHQAGVLYVVVTNSKGIRLSHPDPTLIGKPIYAGRGTAGDDSPASESFRTGRPWVGIQVGSLGETARGKAPIFDAKGRLIGEVSVGIAVRRVTAFLLGELPSIAAYMAVALVLGTLLSLALTRRLKRQTFGLELDEIAALLQEREAMLHGIREGVLGVDNRGRILLANDGARRLLHLPEDCLGRAIGDFVPPGRLYELINGVASEPDQLVAVDAAVLVVNCMPIRARNRHHLGWISTLQDRTESEGLMRELDSVVGLTETLRAQSHEFSNRLHTLVGLVELGRNEEAVSFATGVSSTRNELTHRLLADIDDPMIVALLLGKSSLAQERGVELRVTADSPFGDTLCEVGDVLTVIGNLVENAIDAAGSAPEPRYVEIQLSPLGADLLLRVSDSGRGIPEESREQIFDDGWTTKASFSGARRGLGLTLVRQVVERHGGLVAVETEIGAVFSVLLPGALRPAETLVEVQSHTKAKEEVVGR
ncbi:MAG: ATP-binding protein [Acidimicrobiales bacterium]